MLRNTCKAFVSFLLVTQITDAMDPSLTPMNNNQSHSSTEPLSAGRLFDSLGNNQNPAIECMCSFLDLRDIAHLRRTCKALCNAWDNDRPLIFDRKKLIRIGRTESLESNITALANKLEGCKNVILNLSSCHLTELPDAISKLTQLKRLDLFDNSITPTALTKLCSWLPNLQELNLSCCDLTELPEAISKLKQLKRLGIGWNLLTPGNLTKLCNLTSLERLNLDLCRITELPGEISKLKQLKQLNIGCNNLTPAALTHLCSLSGLQELNLGECNLTDLPEAISKLTQLKRLIIYSNNLTQTALTQLCSLSNLQELDLSNCNLTEVPEEISKLTQLKRLDLTFNSFTPAAQDTIRRWLPNTKIDF